MRKKFLALLLVWIPYFIWRLAISEHRDPISSCIFFAIITGLLLLFWDYWPISWDKKEDA